MGMTTSTWTGRMAGGNNSGFVFYYDSNTKFWVEEFNAGVAKLMPPMGPIDRFADILVSCFDAESKFVKKLKAVYGSSSELKSISFRFRGIDVTASKGTTAEEILNMWEAGAAAEREAHEIWLKTPDGQRYLEEQEAKRARKEARKAEVLKIDEEVEFEFSSGEEGKKEWNLLLEGCPNNPCHAAVVRFARRWAKCMQIHMAAGKSLSEVAAKTAWYSDVEEITDNMQAQAIKYLAKCWRHGSELLKWHNKQYGYMGDDGVINPAVLTS